MNRYVFLSQPNRAFEPLSRFRISAMSVFIVVAAAMFLSVGCDNPQSIPLIPPNFTVTNVKTDHGIFTAVWYVTIHNNGGPGSMLVQKWIGSRTDPSSRTVIYSERISLGALQEKTIKIEWNHYGIGTIADALWYGGSDGIEFLP